MVLQGRDICSSKQRSHPTVPELWLKSFQRKPLKKHLYSPTLTSKTDHLWERQRAMPQNTEPTHSQGGRGDSNVSLWSRIFLKIKKQLCGTFLLGLLVTEQLPYFLSCENKLFSVFWGEQKRKTIVILFQKFKWWCSDSNLSTSWEKFKVGRERPLRSSPGEGAGGYLGSIDALHRLEQLVCIIRERASIFFKHTQ